MRTISLGAAAAVVATFVAITSEPENGAAAAEVSVQGPWGKTRGASRLGYTPRLRRHRLLRLKEFPVPGHDEDGKGDDEGSEAGEDDTQGETDAESQGQGGESFIKTIFATVCETVENVCVVLPHKSALSTSSSSASATATPAPVPQASFK